MDSFTLDKAKSAHPVTCSHNMKGKVRASSKMNRKAPQIKVIWEQEPTTDASDRLLAAFEMIFEDIPISAPVGKQPPLTSNQ